MSTVVPKEPLRTLFAAMTGLPVAVIIWDGEPKGPVVQAQDARRLVLAVVARRAVGKDETTREYPDASTIRFTYKGQRVISLSVRAENYGTEEGFDLLESVRTQLDQGDTGETLNASDLSYNGSGDVRNLDVTAHNRRISVAQLDVFLNQTVTRVVDKVVSDANPSYIESVEITGEDELAGAGTDVITSP